MCLTAREKWLMKAAARRAFGFPNEIYDDWLKENEQRLASEAPSNWISEEDKCRFWVKGNDTGYCIEWTGALNNHGYGNVCINQNRMGAHRAAYGIAYNKNPDELGHIAHKCDNPKCINPQHLFETDHLGNMIDRQVKGRGKRIGSSSKFTGVSWRNDSKRWRAVIKTKGKYKHLGTFDNEYDAAKAYDAEMVNSFGYEQAKASLNFPNDYTPPTDSATGED